MHVAAWPQRKEAQMGAADKSWHTKATVMKLNGFDTHLAEENYWQKKTTVNKS